jgi:hypothetical protein
MKPAQLLVVFVALALCLAWMLITWPGSSSRGEFYAYPVTLPLFAFWALGWIVILVPTRYLIRKLRKK